MPYGYGMRPMPPPGLSMRTEPVARMPDGTPEYMAPPVQAVRAPSAPRARSRSRVRNPIFGQLPQEIQQAYMLNPDPALDSAGPPEPTKGQRFRGLLAALGKLGGQLGMSESLIETAEIQRKELEAEMMEPYITAFSARASENVAMMQQMQQQQEEEERTAKAEHQALQDEIAWRDSLLDREKFKRDDPDTVADAAERAYRARAEWDNSQKRLMREQDRAEREANLPFEIKKARAIADAQYGAAAEHRAPRLDAKTEKIKDAGLRADARLKQIARTTEGRDPTPAELAEIEALKPAVDAWEAEKQWVLEQIGARGQAQWGIMPNTDYGP